MNLLDFQRRMAEDVSRPLTMDFAMQDVAYDGTSVEEIAADYIKPNDLLSSFERLEIYNRQYWFRVIGAVSEDYPALSAMLGQKRCEALILAYLKENPSTSFTLRDLGAKLPSWLESHPELAGPHRELAVDVARLEWAYIEAFDRPALPPLNTVDLSRLLPTSVLALQPHLQLLALRYGVDEAVLAVHRNKPATDIVSNAVTERKEAKRLAVPRLRRSPTYLAVHRYQDSVYYRRIDREAFLLFLAIQVGEPISSVVERAMTASKLPAVEQAAKVREYFAHASELGWLTAK
jgi:Putative DNA-binding domain